MTDLILREWNQKRIRIREDKYVCLTDMAKASGKNFASWNRLESSKSYLKELSLVMQIHTSKLIEVKRGKPAKLQGTWGHPKVALRFAQWCSDKFAIQVDCWIDRELRKGIFCSQEG